MKAVYALSALLLAGCAHVLDLGEGQHSLTISTHSRAVAREEAVEAAQDFCKQAHHFAVIDSFEDAGGFRAESSIVFHCK